MFSSSQTSELKALCASLTSSLAVAESRAADAEAALKTSVASATEAETRLSAVERQRDRAVERAEQLQEKATSAENELKQANAAMQSVVASTDALGVGVCALLNRAQEAAADAPQLEAQVSGRRLDVGTSSLVSSWQQRLQLAEANFAAALKAFGSASDRNEGLVDGAMSLAEPLRNLRRAVRTAAGTKLAGGRGHFDAALDSAVREWQNRGMQVKAALRGHSFFPPVKPSAITSRAVHDDGSSSPGRSGVFGSQMAALAKAEMEAAEEEEEAQDVEDEGDNKDEKKKKKSIATGGAPAALISTKFEVVVPDGAAAGDTLFVSLPTGEEVKVVVPADAPDGSVLTCSALTTAPR